MKTIKKSVYFMLMTMVVFSCQSNKQEIIAKKDFSFMGGFITSGIVLAFAASIILLVSSMLGYYFPLMMLGISSLFALLMCGLILFQTSSIVNGGEDNYVMATVTLYISIYNLFTSLLHILTAFMGNND